MGSIPKSKLGLVPTLSVIMPNYNHARYLPQALDAVLSQSFRPIEIVVIDDASTDDSVEIIEHYARADATIRLVRNPQNLGHLVSLQKVIGELRGDYVHSTAADDVVMPALYEKSMNLLAQHPSAGLCTALARYIDEEGRPQELLPTPSVSSSERYIAPQEVLSLLRKQEPWFTSVTSIYRRDALIEVGCFLPVLQNYADAFSSRVLALGYGACFVPAVLGCWRRMSKGFAATMHADLQQQIDIVAHATKILAIPPYSNLAPSAYAKQWTREWMFDVLVRIQGDRQRRVAALLNTGVALSLPDRIFLWFFRWAPVGASFLGRVYYFCFVRKGSLAVFFKKKFVREKVAYEP